MRVALDTGSLYVTRAGTTRYVRGLLRGLRELQPPGVNIAELAWPVENLAYRQPWRAAKTLYRELIWSRLIALRALVRMKADLLHRCTPSLPIAKGNDIREVVTLHDLAVLRFPERFRPWHRHVDRLRLPMLGRADRIICDSRFTAEEAMRLLGLSAAKLEVIHLGSEFGADTSVVPAPSPVPSLPERFFLFVGSLEPGKNLALLREAYALADGRGVELPPMVIVGARWPGVRGEGAPDRRWHYLGYQSDAVLAWLYRQALALVFPSLYEGFGLPVLEAMTLGCPVVCSRVASLPEVGGDAPFYVDMTAAAYLEAMIELVRAEATRGDLIRRGVAQASRFSWRLCAAQTVDVYRAAIG